MVKRSFKTVSITVEAPNGSVLPAVVNVLGEAIAIKSVVGAGVKITGLAILVVDPK